MRCRLLIYDCFTVIKVNKCYGNGDMCKQTENMSTFAKSNHKNTKYTQSNIFTIKTV